MLDRNAMDQTSNNIVQCNFYYHKCAHLDFHLLPQKRVKEWAEIRQLARKLPSTIVVLKRKPIICIYGFGLENSWKQIQSYLTIITVYRYFKTGPINFISIKTSLTFIVCAFFQMMHQTKTRVWSKKNLNLKKGYLKTGNRLLRKQNTNSIVKWWCK